MEERVERQKAARLHVLKRALDDAIVKGWWPRRYSEATDGSVEIACKNGMTFTAEWHDEGERTMFRGRWRLDEPRFSA
jgi:hypothetical protein